MISNQYDQQNHFIMYEQELYTDILYIAAQQKIYARTSDQVTIYSTQSIPYPQQGDIIITDHGASGKDIEIRLKVMGSVSEATKTEELVIPVEILQTSRELDEQGVRDLIGSKVYNITCLVYRDNVVQDSGSSEVEQNSDIEIN